MTRRPPLCPSRPFNRMVALALCATLGNLWAADHGAAHAPAAATHAPAGKTMAAAPRAGAAPEDAHAAATQLKNAVEERFAARKGKVSLVVGDEPHAAPARAPQRLAAAAPHASGHESPLASSRNASRARAAVLGGHAAPEGAHSGTAAHAPHWSYEGEYGPENWAGVKPEFNACAIGKRQSPVHIQETGTLQGPAEPLVFDYRPSGGSVVNNGHTIQVDLEPGNTLSVRGSTYQLLQFHFHHPAEEKVNYKGFSMVAHLVHKDYEGRLAVVAVLIDPGAANELIHKVWTHMPLDSGDRVRLPPALIDMNALLPSDQRYYQFMGSLTTPPCTEGVLWNVLKAPVTVSKEQLKLFAQLFPMNARPVQALNGRVVRDAQ